MVQDGPIANVLGVHAVWDSVYFLQADKVLLPLCIVRIVLAYLVLRPAPIADVARETFTFLWVNLLFLNLELLSVFVFIYLLMEIFVAK